MTTEIENGETKVWDVYAPFKSNADFDEIESVINDVYTELKVPEEKKLTLVELDSINKEKFSEDLKGYFKAVKDLNFNYCLIPEFDEPQNEKLVNLVGDVVNQMYQSELSTKPNVFKCELFYKTDANTYARA